MNSLRWAMALVGRAASVAVPPDAVAGFDWSAARIASPTPKTAARSAPAATVKMTKSQPSLVLVGGGGGAGGPAWPPGRGFGAGSSPSVGATLGSVLTLMARSSASGTGLRQGPASLPRGTLVPVAARRRFA